MMINNFNFKHIGLLSAMPEEIGTIIKCLENINETVFGDLKIYSGSLRRSTSKSLYLSVAFSGWGKVSAARATTRLISIKYQGLPIDLILFTGVAASAKSDLNQWDIVLGDCLLQHDMEATPIFEKFVIPPLKRKELHPNKLLLNYFYENLAANNSIVNHQKFGRVKKGIIASGDKFISDLITLEKLNSEIPNLSAIEMEGAAFAQVAIQENIQWLVVRVISDNAKEGSEEDFGKFIKTFKNYSHELINVLRNLIN